MRREFVPVYLITGFLESGKTTLATSILENERYTNGGKVLILCCEEGETEYDEKKLQENRCTLVNLEEPEELNSERLAQLEKEIRPSCVIVEYNNMWGIEKLGELRLPVAWDWAQIVTAADGTTFENYMTNMRKLLTDPMKEADLIIINRCGESFNKSSWRKQLRALNPGATILFENLDGSVDDGISAIVSDGTPHESMSRYLHFFISGRISRTAAPLSVIGLWFRSIASSSVVKSRP